jgi:hypothetical protein
MESPGMRLPCPRCCAPVPTAGGAHVLSALTEARDTLSQWIDTITRWPVAPAVSPPGGPLAGGTP